MSGSSKSSGFTLIELVLVLALIGLMAALVLPRINKTPVRESFVRQLNALLELAYHHAVMSGKIARIFFDFKNRTITLEEEQKERKAGGELQFKPVTVDYVKTTIPWPDTFTLQSFYINEKFDNAAISTIYFMIMPQGLAQRVTINIQERDDGIFALVLNPFLVHFTVYDEPQKP